MKRKQKINWLEDKNRLQQEYDRRMPGYDLVLEHMIRRLENLVQNTGTMAHIKGRVKDFNVFLKKLILKSQGDRIDDPFEEITDIIGLRIVVPFVEDIKSMEVMISGYFEVVETDYKSLGLTIKEFGYDSTHFLVEIPGDIEGMDPEPGLFAEIQLCTILQEAWAEVEHELVYKTSIESLADAMRRKLISLKAMLSLADTTFQELRDYQKKRIHDLEERHKKLLDKVSTIPEKAKKAAATANGRESRAGASNGADYPDAEMNELYFEALNAHLDNRLEKAIQLYTHLIMISPNQYLYNHRGLVYFTLSEYEKAEADFTEAIAIDPTDRRVYTNRGMAYRMLKRYDAAIADFNRSLELNPLWPDTFYGRALVFYDMGDIRAAVEDCDMAIKLNPQFKQAVRFKEYILNQNFE